MQEVLERLGDRIRVLREEAGHTQTKAAELAKLDEKHWSDLENGRSNPTVATLVGVARALNVEVSDLFSK